MVQGPRALMASRKVPDCTGYVAPPPASTWLMTVPKSRSPVIATWRLAPVVSQRISQPSFTGKDFVSLSPSPFSSATPSRSAPGLPLRVDAALLGGLGSSPRNAQDVRTPATGTARPGRAL